MVSIIMVVKLSVKARVVKIPVQGSWADRVNMNDIPPICKIAGILVN